VEGTFFNKLKVGLNVAPSYSTQTLNDFERDFVDILAYSQWLSPIIPAKQADGSRTPYITSPGMFGSSNPLDWLQYAPGKTDLLSGIATATASYEFVPGLSLKYSFNVSYNSSNYFRFDPSYLVGPFQALPPDIPSSTTTKYTSTDWLSEILLTYDKTFGNHKLNVVAGYTAQKDHWHGLSLNATNYPDDKVQTINAAALVTPNYDDIQEWSLLSYLARVNYNYKNKYLLTATVRSDGSSRFGANNRYGTFPSIGVGWNASEENFLKNVSWLNNLKIRGSYGRSGNFDIGNYTQVSNVGSNNYVFGGAIAPGRNASTLGNPNLTWEKAEQVDAGIDATMFNSRLAVTVDYYRRVTTSMLYNSQIALSSGYGSAIINAGKILNNGVEISVTSQNIRSHSFTWSTNFNIAFNHNEVLALNQNNDPILSGRSGEGSYTHITQVGHPIGQFFGYVWEGVYVDQADFDKSPKNATSVVGSIKYKDVDGNGIIEPVKDFAVIGTAQPDFVYGMTNNFTYGDFDFSFLISGSQGGQVYKKNNQYLHNIDGVFNVTKDVLNRWRSPDEPGNGRVPTTNGGRVLYRDISSLDIENGSFLRVRNITLGYNLPKSLMNKTNVFKGARIYAAVQNAFIFTNYTGANPDVNRNGNSALEPGEDFTNYPLSRLYLLGINFSF
jgi:TonB-linked SusC/RagA family outer membrane protein